MIVRLERRRPGYVIIDRSGLEDKRLTWEARGMLAYLLSRPDDWQIIFPHLVSCAPSSDYQVRKIFKELQRHGYAELITKRGKGGRVEGTEWVVYEVSRYSDNLSGGGDGQSSHRDDEIRNLGRRGDENRNLGDRDDEIPDLGESPTSGISQPLLNNDSSLPNKEGGAKAPARSPGKKGRAKPSEDEVTAYFTEVGHPGEARKFWLYYESSGWKGVRDWKAKALLWLERDGFKPGSPATPALYTHHEAVQEWERRGKPGGAFPGVLFELATKPGQKALYRRRSDQA